MGLFLIVDSGTGLLTGDRPPLGVVVIWGQVIWTGWLMIAVMALSCVGPVILGRMKTAPAEVLHDKVLYADADMNRADWQTGVATIVGVLGIGMGLWWADAAAALVVSVSILRDGWANLNGAITGLMDRRPTRFDGTDPHPLVHEIDEDARVAVLVGHNPTVAMLAALLPDGSGDPQAEQAVASGGFPPGSVAVFRVEGTWWDVREGRATLVAHHVGGREG